MRRRQHRSNDFCVKVDPTGLTSGTVYYYGFTAYGRNSLTGRTRTAPSGQQADHLRFGVVSCSNYPAGFFNAYGRLADRNDLDAVLHLGDYIYEYDADTTSYGGALGKELGRMHEPDAELVTLADYRTRYAQYRLDPDLMRLHQQCAVVHVWDDHESANDSYTDGAENHDPDTEGDWEARKAASKRVHAEWMPIREQSDKIYRRLPYGDLLDIFMIDTRLDGRMKQVQGIGEDASQESLDSLNDPDRRIMSPEQYDWLTTGLSQSTARWRVIGNQVLFAPVESNPVDTAYLFEQVDPFVALFLRAQLPALQAIFDLAFKGDVWNNYPAQREKLAAHIRTNEIPRTVIVTGDFHTSFALDGTWDQGQQPFVEFMTPSITSSNFDENLSSVPTIAPLAPVLVETVSQTLEQNNDFIAWHDIVNHGYLILDVTTDRVQSDWYFVDTLYERSEGEAWAQGQRTTGGGVLTTADEEAPGKSVQDTPAPPDPPAVVSVSEEGVADGFVVIGYGPNPTSEGMYVSFTSEQSREITYQVIDVAGSVVASFSRDAFAGLNSTLIDLRGVSSGQYTLVMTTETTMRSIPIVVQR